jgi:hypothetical protein
MMRARRYHRAALRKGSKPNIVRFQDLKIDDSRSVATLLADHGVHPSKELLHDLDLMTQATNLGSLIVPTATTEEIKAARTQVQSEVETSNDLFARNALRELDTALGQLVELGRTFWCVVDNPPYLGMSKANPGLKAFVNKNFSLSKADLMATFMERGLTAVQKGGYLGMINQHSWMFLSSYEKLRAKLIEEVQFDTMLHLGPRAFPEIGGEVVQSTTFTFQKVEPERKGVYLRLVDDKSTELKEEKAIAADASVDYFHLANQADFAKIPGSPVGYWVGEKMLLLFEKSIYIGDVAKPRRGLATNDNQRFTRFWHEVSYNNFNVSAISREDSQDSRKKWFPYTKGGNFRKWYGNNEYAVNWENDGSEMFELATEKYGSPTRTIKNLQFYFKPGVTWTMLGSGLFGARMMPQGTIFDQAADSLFTDENTLYRFCAVLNTMVRCILGQKVAKIG